MSSTCIPIDLAKPRILAFRVGGNLLQFTFRPATAADWKQYFEAIVFTSEFDGKRRNDTTDTRSAKLGIVGACLTAATGYAAINGQPLAEHPNWQNLIPVSHRLVLGDMFVATKRFLADASDDDGGFVITLEGERVEIESFWTFDPELRAMLRSAPLVHHFATPTPDQQRRFARDSSRSQITGGSRTQRTVWKGAQLTLIQLYDELIQRVEGYAGEGFVSDRPATIITSMDAFHKVVAASQLFAAAEIETETEA